MATQVNRESGAGAVHVRVSGRVQGVGFRYFIVSRAEAVGAVGYARNLADGDVEIRAEGPAEVLEAVIAAARSGPRGSSVENVEVRRVKAEGSFRGFEVRY